MSSSMASLEGQEAEGIDQTLNRNQRKCPEVSMSTSYNRVEI